MCIVQIQVWGNEGLQSNLLLYLSFLASFQATKKRLFHKWDKMKM